MKTRMALTLRDIGEGLRTQPGRVGLSFLAVMIGIVALTILIAILEGLEHKSRLMVKELGANVVALMAQGDGKAGSSARLDERSVNLLANNLAECSVSAVKRYSVSAAGADSTITVMATDDALAHVRQWKLKSGRFLDPWDLRRGERHVVVTQALSGRQNWNVGSTIMLQTVPFTVVGVVDAGGGAADSASVDIRVQTGERTVFVPRTVAVPWMGKAGPYGEGLDTVFIRVDSTGDMNAVIRSAQRMLAAPGFGLSRAAWITPASLVEGIKRLQATIRFSVGSIALLCLMLGGTTLMSLMVANVRDRVKEIGLRRALGARAREVAALFVAEACFITVAASAAGTLVASLILIGGRDRFPAPLGMGPATFLIPVLASLALGCIFSFWPARMAAKISPAEALRNE